MSYDAPLHFAVKNLSSMASDRDVAVWTEGCRQQLQRHVASLWDLPPPGAAVYPDSATFPEGTALVCAFVDDIGLEATLGIHSIAGKIPFVLIDAGETNYPSIVLSHEFIEAFVNQYLDRWTTEIRQGGHSYHYPLEPCDPVEGDSYHMPVDMGAGLESVAVSNFVFPSWYDPASSASRFDFLGDLKSPLQIAPGGYAAPEVDGEVQFIGAAGAPFVHIPRRKLMAWSRFSRLVQKGRK